MLLFLLQCKTTGGLGRRAEAKAHLLEALPVHPDYPEAQKALAALDAAPGS